MGLFEEPRSKYILEREFGEVSQLPHDDLDRRTFRVWQDAIPFDCHLRKLPGGSDRLFVMLHGAIKRNFHIPPIFARMDWGARVNGHILAVSDPTLLMSDDVHIGWYVGSAERDPIPGLITISRAVARGIGAREIVFYGSSAGGFAAIAAASRSGETAIAINPQTDIALYGKGTKAVAKLFVGSPDVATARDNFPERWLSVNMVERALRAGKKPRIILAQNVQDEEHLHGHFKPFCNAFRRRFPWRRPRLKTVLFNQAGGHGVKETPELARRLARML